MRRHPLPWLLIPLALTLLAAQDPPGPDPEVAPDEPSAAEGADDPADPAVTLAPPAALEAIDYFGDVGGNAWLGWLPSPDDPAEAVDELIDEATAAAEVEDASEPDEVEEMVPPTDPLEPEPEDVVPAGVQYRVFRSLTPPEIAEKNREAFAAAIAEAKAEATLAAIERVREEPIPEEERADFDVEAFLAELEATDPEAATSLREAIRVARLEAAETRAAELRAEFESREGEIQWTFVGIATNEHLIETDRGAEYRFLVEKLTDDATYRFAVEAFAGNAVAPRVATATPFTPGVEPFDPNRRWLLIILSVLCFAILLFIVLARSGIDLKIRKIAGLEAVDEAVGRATEMGRPVLFVPGIQDVNDIQTIAGLTILSRVAKTAAEYDARIEVPTARSLVMTTARETVEGSYLAAGRPDAYDEDSIYYVTDEQFGYVAYLSGHMVREKPAACFYLGSFYAESLILAETGNAIGAIQIAGTAQPAQLPFFVAACDYTLIGEEFFAASAYLSGTPEELGSLKGQDVGKLIVAGFMAVGILIFTVGMILLPGETGLGEAWLEVAEYIRTEMLS